MKFNTSLILGRFQPVHIGHQKLIDIALEISNKVVVFVGSSDKGTSKRNPFDAEYRKKLIELIYAEEIKEGKVIVKPLPDLTDENDLTYKWGEYVVENAENVLNERLECIIYGKEQSINKCFSTKLLENITEIAISRNQITISATKLREYIINDDIENFKKYTSNKIHSEYEYLRKVLMDIEKKEEN